MPTITLNKTVFEKLVGKKLALEQLKDRISMLGTDLEKIEGDEIQVEIFPNRPDLLSEAGFARAFASFIGVKAGLREYKVKKSGLRVIVDKSVTMRPYTACAIVKNLYFADESIRELMQMQEKLATTHGRNRKKSAYGIYPLDIIQFPIHYIAKDPHQVRFRPLGLDFEISASKVEELHPKGKEYQHIAAGWSKYPFFIDAKGKVLSMLPYINSHETGRVDQNTKDVFIECSGTDLQNVMVALNMFVTMLADMSGEIYSLEVVYPDQTFITPNLTPGKMKLDVHYINKILGLELKENQVIALLERMGYGYEAGMVLIPAYRADILHPVDLIEDIAIAYGYEHFEEIIPNVATIGEENPFEVFARKVREALVGLRMIEVKNYHLLPKAELNQNMLLQGKGIPLKNALGEYNHLRDWILPSLLKTLSQNQHNEYPQNMFELGRAFFHDPKEETGIREEEHLALTLAHEKADFTEMRQIVDAFLSLLDLEGNIRETTHPSFIPGRVGEIRVGKELIGIMGEFHPQVLTNWNVTMPVVGAELDLELLKIIIKRDRKK